MRKFARLITPALLSAGFFVAVGCGPPAATSGPPTGPAPKAPAVNPPAASPAKDPEFKTTAEALAKEAFTDPQTFDAKYKGKVVEVEGKVARASVIVTNDGFSLIGAKKPDGIVLDVDCTLPNDQKAKGHALGKGQKVKVVGQVVSVNALAIILDQCSFTELEASPATKVTAVALAAEFAKDAVAAKNKYGVNVAQGKEVVITGTVADLKDKKTGFGERRSIILTGADGVTVDVDCALHKWVTDGLKKGDKVTVKGEIFKYEEDTKTVGVGLSYVAKQD